MYKQRLQRERDRKAGLITPVRYRVADVVGASALIVTGAWAGNAHTFANVPGLQTSQCIRFEDCSAYPAYQLACERVTFMDCTNVEAALDARTFRFARARNVLILDCPEVRVLPSALVSPLETITIDSCPNARLDFDVWIPGSLDMFCVTRCAEIDAADVVRRLRSGEFNDDLEVRYETLYAAEINLTERVLRRAAARYLSAQPHKGF